MVEKLTRWLLPVLLTVSGPVVLMSVEKVDGQELVVDRILPLYEELPKSQDPVAKKYQHVFEVTVRDVIKLAECSGWLAQISAPTNREPPYYGDNHHFEYWGVLADGQYFLGRGEYFELSQHVEVGSFADFISAACPDLNDEKMTATAYLQVELAGRFPFASAHSDRPRMWAWLSEVSDVLTEWRDEILQVSAIPPAHDTSSDGVVYRGCVLALVGSGHNDVGCWDFGFDVNGRLLGVHQAFRRQSVPGFASDAQKRE